MLASSGGCLSGLSADEPQNGSLLEPTVLIWVGTLRFGSRVH